MAYTGWNYKRTLTDANSTSVTDFVIDVTLTGANFDFSHAQSDGSDLRFYDETSAVEVPWWIESYASPNATIHVRVNDMTHTHSMYYGNASAAVFQIPPMGPFEKRSDNPLSSTPDVKPEQIIKDDDGTLYFVASDQSNGNCHVYKCSTGDPWTGTWTFLKNLFSHTGDATPTIQKYNGTWYAFYSSNTAGNVETYVCSSSTFLGTYSGDTKIVSHGAAASWEEQGSQENYAFIDDDGRWKMLYMGYTPAVIEQVGVATTAGNDPFATWTKEPTNPVIKFNADAIKYDIGTIADPWVYKLNGVYYGGYTNSRTDNTIPWNIAIATSTDFINWTKRRVILHHGDQGTTDRSDSHRGSIYLHTDNYYYLPYLGSDGTSYRACLSRQYAMSTATGYPKEQVFDCYIDFSLGATAQVALHGGTGGSMSVSGGVLKILSGTGTLSLVQTVQSFRPGYRIDIKAQHISTDGTANHASAVGFAVLSGVSGTLGTGFGHNIRIYAFNQTKYIKQCTASATTSSNMAQNYTNSPVVHTIKWVSASSMLFSNDGGADEQITTNITTQDVPIAFESFASSSNNTELDIFYIKARRYAAIEPSITVGSEINLNSTSRTSTSTSSGGRTTTSTSNGGRTAITKS